MCTRGRASGSHDGPIGQPADNTKPRANVERMELARRAWLAVLARVLELLGFQIEDRDLIVFLSRRKVQGVANSGIHREALRQPPVILDEVLLPVCAVADLLVLQIDRKLLDLTQKKTGQRCARGAGEPPPGSAAGSRSSRCERDGNLAPVRGRDSGHPDP